VLFAYLEGFYKQRRRHSPRGLSPEELKRR